MNENRQHIRFPSPDIKATYLLQPGNIGMTTICKDISVGGLLIPETMSRNETISLGLSFPPYNRVFRIKGNVAWSKEKNSGIKFVENRPDLKEKIDEYILYLKRINEPNFLLLLKLFSPINRPTINEIFYIALKVLYFRQYRSRKPILNAKEIVHSLDLVKDYIIKYKLVDVKDELAELLTKKGVPVSEDGAFSHCCDKIPEKVQDKYGRDIVLGEEVFNSLFKDPITGKKVQLSENFQQTRAKRLPWIVYILKNATQIYEMNERDWMTYYYTMSFSVPYKEEVTKEEKSNIDYYLVVTRRKRGRPIEFVTSYPTDGLLELLKKFCSARPYNPISDVEKK